ncbi:MAG TPA: TIM barrel protein [Chthoniobacterales bacterium]
MQTGLVSITFRQLKPREIVPLVQQAGLQCIEWGGDIHVPVGDIHAAHDVAKLTADAGLTIVAYGSYYRTGYSLPGEPSFETIIETAVALGAPCIRVWPGRVSSETATPSDWKAIINDSLRCARLAEAAGLCIAYEYHSGTLTDTVDSTRRLLEATVHPAIYTLWQPPYDQTKEHCLESLRAVIQTERLHHVHAFHWWPDSANRLSLADGADRWQAYIAEIKKAANSPAVLLEFLPNNDPHLLTREAAILNEWAAKIGG